MKPCCLRNRSLTSLLFPGSSEHQNLTGTTPCFVSIKYKKRGGDDGTSPNQNLLCAGRGDEGFWGAFSTRTVRQSTVVTELREAEQRLMKKFHPLRNPLLEHPGTKKRSGIPIAPSGTECVARQDDAKRPPPSPTRRSDFGLPWAFFKKRPRSVRLTGSAVLMRYKWLNPPFA